MQNRTKLFVIGIKLAFCKASAGIEATDNIAFCGGDIADVVKGDDVGVASADL